jgi:hypothetical protein
MRWLLVLAAIGCAEKIYEDPPNGMRLPSDQAGYREGREEAIDAARIAAEVACDRLWSDCSSLCDEIFVYCGNSEEQCVEDYARDAVEDLQFPVYSVELAEQCADQLGRRSCLDLDPNSAQCEAAVLEGCPDDSDGYGRNYSWLGAHELTELPTTLSPHLCQGTREWFVFHLEAGEAVTMTLIGGTGSGWADLYAPVGDADRRDVANVGHSIHFDPTSDFQETEMFEPAPTAGIYYLQIYLNDVPRADVELAIGTDRRAPPTVEEVAFEAEKVVYRALCERLHGDCASACSEVDFYCGGSVEECTEAYAASAVEHIFDRESRILDRNLASSCAADLAQRSCGDLKSASCGDLLVSHCETDPLAYGRPWSGRMAKSVSLPATVDLDLCEDVRQFYRIDLSAGDQLVMRTLDDPVLGTVYGRLYPPNATDEDLFGENNALFYSYYLDSSEEITDPVPFTGTYYYQVEYHASGPIRLMLRRL